MKNKENSEFKFEVDKFNLKLGDKVRLILDRSDAYYDLFKGEYIGIVTKEYTSNSSFRVDGIYFLQNETKIFLSEYRDKQKVICISHKANDVLQEISSLSFRINMKATNALGSSAKRPIEHDENGFHLKDSKQPIKVTKILSVIYPELTPLELEKYANRYKELYTIDTSNVIVSSSICDVYDISSVGGSCMANKGHFMNIYEQLGCKIAYLLDDNDDLIARAILWDNNIVDEEGTPYRIMDRVFYEKEVDKLTLYKWHKENGYTRFSKNKDKSFTTIESVGTQEYVPYVDTMKYVISDCYNSYKLTSDSSSDFIDYLEETEGASSENSGISLQTKGVWCVDIDECRPEDEVFYCETDNEYYAYADDLVYIEGYGFYRDDDDAICYTEDTNRYTFKENCYVTIHGEFYEDGDYLVWCDDIEEYVDADDSFEYVEDLEAYHYNTEGYYRDPEGYLWSDEDAYLEAKGIKACTI